MRVYCTMGAVSGEAATAITQSTSCSRHCQGVACQGIAPAGLEGHTSAFCTASCNITCNNKPVASETLVALQVVSLSVSLAVRAALLSFYDACPHT